MIDNQHISEVLQQLPSALTTHLQLVVISAFFAILIGVPLGILAASSIKWERVIIPTINLIQTIPSLALFGLLIPLAFFGIGLKTAIFGLFIYSLLPIIKNTTTGIKDIDPAIIDAATGIGLPNRNILTKIKLPIAFSSIFGGIRISIIRNVGTATIASYIGAGGLGDLVFLGISNNDSAYLYIGAISITLLALLLDFLLASLERDMRHKSFTLFKKVIYTFFFIILILIPIIIVPIVNLFK